MKTLWEKKVTTNAQNPMQSVTRGTSASYGREMWGRTFMICFVEIKCQCQTSECSRALPHRLWRIWRWMQSVFLSYLTVQMLPRIMKKCICYKKNITTYVKYLDCIQHIQIAQNIISFKCGKFTSSTTSLLETVVLMTNLIDTIVEATP